MAEQEGMLEGKTIREWVLWLLHSIKGNGGRGLMTRVDDVEKESEFLQVNYVDKKECLNNRTADYSKLELKIDALSKQLEKIDKKGLADKRMNIAIIGIVVSAGMSAASLFISVL